MNYRRNQFPLQTVPIYDFQIRDGQLVRTEYFRYELNTVGSKSAYRIYTETGIKSKRPEQLDVALNGHVWTFDRSCRTALEHFRARAEDDLVRAATMAETARRNMLDVQAAETNLDPDGI